MKRNIFQCTFELYLIDETALLTLYPFPKFALTMAENIVIP